MYTTYVISNGSKIYIGQTSDLVTRLKRHNGLLITNQRAYTKINKGPWVVIYQEDFHTRDEAVARENFLKSHHGRDWIKNILGR